MMARKISQPVCAVSLELLTASSRLYGLTGVSVSGVSRALSAILLGTPALPRDLRRPYGKKCDITRACNGQVRHPPCSFPTEHCMS